MKRILAVIGISALSVTAQAQSLLNESFSYPDGDLKITSGGLWASHGGGSTPLNNFGGQAFIDQNDLTSGRDDYNRALSSSFDPTTDNTSKIYFSLLVNFSALPFNGGTSTAGSYFAHLKSSAANNFYSRIGANQEGILTPGTFRIAVCNSTWNSAATIEFPQDLLLNTSYLVVGLLDLATDRTTLWIDPTTEGSTSVTATDALSYPAGGLINAFALRQGTTGTSPNGGAPGDVWIDSLKVGTTFSYVIPEPGSAALLVLGGLLLLRRRQ